MFVLDFKYVGPFRNADDSNGTLVKIEANFYTFYQM